MTDDRQRGGVDTHPETARGLRVRPHAADPEGEPTDLQPGVPATAGRPALDDRAEGSCCGDLDRRVRGGGGGRRRSRGPGPVRGVDDRRVRHRGRPGRGDPQVVEDQVDPDRWMLGRYRDPAGDQIPGEALDHAGDRGVGANGRDHLFRFGRPVRSGLRRHRRRRCGDRVRCGGTHPGRPGQSPAHSVDPPAQRPRRCHHHRVLSLRPAVPEQADPQLSGRRRQAGP